MFLYLILAPAGLSAQAGMPEKVTGPMPRTYWQFMFFYESTRTADQSEVIYRLPFPVYHKYKNIERGYEKFSFLHPLYVEKSTYYWSRWSVLEIFTGFSHYKEDQGEDDEVSLTPMFMWGSGDTEKERYSGFFPFYGTWKDKLSYQEINYVGFPFYLNWKYEDYEAHSVFWPLIMWGSSITRDDFRILFVYSHKIHRGKYARYSVLWPFFQWGREDMDKLEPRNYFFFFPFFGRKWSDDGYLSATTVLWPFFSWGRDLKRESYNLRLFWFLYQYEYNNDPYIRKHIVFPIWGKYHYGDTKGYYRREFEFITPFYISIKADRSLMTVDNDFYGLWMYQDLYTYYKKEREYSIYRKLWPVFHYREDSYGNLEFSTLSLLPFRAETFERVWSPIIAGQIAEYREFENGDRYMSGLLRIFARYWNPEEEHVFVAGVEVHDTPDWWSAEFLGGFAGIHRIKPNEEKESETIYRLLWFDI